MEFVIDNLGEFIDVLAYIVAIAAAIAAMTKNPKDDGWVNKARKVVDFLALNFGSAENDPAKKPKPKPK